MPLPFQYISVKINVADTKTIGALRVGLYGSGHKYESYLVKELNFYQSFF